MWVWYSAGHQCSLTRPNKHNHSSGQHKEHSVSTLVPQLWLPTQVQGNGNEKLKKEPQEWGWGGVGWFDSPLHGSCTMGCSQKYSCIFLVLVLYISSHKWTLFWFLGDGKWTLFESYRICTYLKVIEWSCQAETLCRTTFRGPDSTHTPKPGALLERRRYEQKRKQDLLPLPTYCWKMPAVQSTEICVTYDTTNQHGMKHWEEWAKSKGIKAFHVS